MCGRATREFEWGELSELVGLMFDEAVFEEEGVGGLRRSYNVAPTQESVVLRRGEDGGGGMRSSVLRWGLVPGWARDGSMRAKMINARAETVREKPSFREAYRKRRCVVPFSSFYEWEEKAGGGAKKAKQPHRVVRGDGGVMWMAGLWEVNEIAFGQRVETFCVVTAAARGRMAELHPRVPVILEAEDVLRWMGGAGSEAEAYGVLGASGDGVLDAYPVDRRVGHVGEDDAGLVERVEVEEQGELFG